MGRRYVSNGMMKLFTPSSEPASYPQILLCKSGFANSSSCKALPSLAVHLRRLRFCGELPSRYPGCVYSGYSTLLFEGACSSSSHTRTVLVRDEIRHFGSLLASEILPFLLQVDA